MASKTENSFASASNSPWGSERKAYRLKIRTFFSWFFSSGDPQVNERIKKLIGTPDYEFIMIAEVLEPDRIQGQRVGRIQFTPSWTGKEPPHNIESIRNRVVLLPIDLTNGSALEPKTIKGNDSGSSNIVEGDGLRALWSNDSNFPLDWIIQAADISTIPKEKVIRKGRRSSPRDPKVSREIIQVLQPVTTKGDGKKAVRIEVSYSGSFGGLEEWKVVQTWVPGEPLWRDFKRYFGDKLNLEAERIPDQGD